MTYGQQTFWVYFYSLAPLFLVVMPLWYLAVLYLTDPDRTAVRRIPPRAEAVAAAVSPVTADWRGASRAPVRDAPRAPGGYR